MDHFNNSIILLYSRLQIAVGLLRLISVIYSMNYELSTVLSILQHYNEGTL